MAAPRPEEELTQLDLQNLPPEQAAQLVRAHAAYLAAQQQHAMLGMVGAMPELQKAGAAEFENAAKERAGGRETAANVFKIALGEKEAAARLKELENQGLYQRGMLNVAMGNLGISGRQQGETERKNVEEERIRDIMTKPTVPSKILEGMSDDERKLAQLDALKQAIPALGWAFDLAKKPVQASHEATKKTVSGYRAMGAQGVPPEAPGAIQNPIQNPLAAAPVGAPATHYRYNKDRTMRIPTDAGGNALGPAEPNR